MIFVFFADKKYLFSFKPKKVLIHLSLTVECTSHVVLALLLHVLL